MDLGLTLEALEIHLWTGSGIVRRIEDLLGEEDERWRIEEDNFEMPYNWPLAYLIKALVNF